MGLFKSDLYRSFAIGFALGAAVLFVTIGDDARTRWAGNVLPAAIAAPAK